MKTQENIKLVRQAYEYFKSGDIDALMRLYAEDIEWILPTMENIPFSGKRQGRAQMTQFFADLNEMQEVLQFDTQHFIGQGDQVVVLGHYIWHVKATDHTFESDWAHVVTVRDGSIVRFQEYTDTAAAVAAYAKVVHT